MKILLPVHEFTDDPKSGLHNEIWSIATNLAKKGNEVFIVSTHTDLKETSTAELKKNNIFLYDLKSIPTHGLGPQESLLVFMASLFLRLKYRFDWIFVLDSVHTPFAYWKLGAKLACRALSPQTEEVQKRVKSPDWEYDRSRKNEEEGWEDRFIPLRYRMLGFFTYSIWLRFFSQKPLAVNCDILFCQGKDTLRYYEQKRKRNVIYLPNGIDGEFFNRKINKIVNKKGFVFLFIGRIARRKGVFYLIDAFKKLNKKYPNTELWIIGKGSTALTKQAKSISGKLLNTNIFFHGEKRRKELVRYIKSCDVVVDSEIYATFSNVCLEALYCGKPVIAPKHGGTKDFVVEGRNGFLIDSTKVSKLIEKMEYFYTHPQKLKKMGEAGHRLIKKNYQWTDVVAEIEKELIKVENDKSE